MVDRLDNSEFTLLGEFEEAPEIEYETEYECPPTGVYLGPETLKYFMASYNNSPYIRSRRPAPIEGEAEVIKTEINKPTKGQLGDG